jgi:hypothetical protein
VQGAGFKVGFQVRFRVPRFNVAFQAFGACDVTANRDL